MQKKLSAKEVKKMVLLTSSMKNEPQGSLHKVLTDAGLTVEKDEFTCKGSFLVMAFGHPNATDINATVVFAENKIRKVNAHD